MNTDRDQDGSITFEQSEVPLDLQFDFPDGRNPNALSLSNDFPYDLQGVRTDVLKALDFSILLEEYRKQAFHKENPAFVSSHKYKRLKKIFDEITTPLKRKLKYYKIQIIEFDRSGTHFKVLIGGREIIIEPSSWDSILVDGKKYDSFEEYVDGIIRKGFYSNDGLEDEGEDSRTFFKVNERLKEELGITHKGDYYLSAGFLPQDIQRGYVAVPGDLKEDYLFGYSRCIADGWGIDQFNYNFARRTENRSCFIPKDVFNRVVISLFEDDSK